MKKIIIVTEIDSMQPNGENLKQYVFSHTKIGQQKAEALFKKLATVAGDDDWEGSLEDGYYSKDAYDVYINYGRMMT